MAILGHAAAPSQTGVSGNAAVASSSPKGLFQVIDALVSNKSYRQSFASNPNSALSAAGVDVGPAKIHMKFVEIEGSDNSGAASLTILVENAKTDWTVNVNLVLQE